MWMLQCTVVVAKPFLRLVPSLLQDHSYRSVGNFKLFLLADRTRPHPVQHNAVLQGITRQEAACVWIHSPRAAQQGGWILDRFHMLPGQEACGWAGFPGWAAPPCSRRLRNDCISSPSRLFLSFPSWLHPNLGVLGFSSKRFWLFAFCLLRSTCANMCSLKPQLIRAAIEAQVTTASLHQEVTRPCLAHALLFICFGTASASLLCRTGRLNIAFFRFVSVDAKEQQQKARGQRRTHLTPFHLLFWDKIDI